MSLGKKGGTKKIKEHSITTNLISHVVWIIIIITTTTITILLPQLSEPSDFSSPAFHISEE